MRCNRAGQRQLHRWADGDYARGLRDVDLRKAAGPVDLVRNEDGDEVPVYETDREAPEGRAPDAEDLLDQTPCDCVL